MKVLLIEDNRTLAKAIERVLKHEGFSIGVCHTGTEGEEFWLQHRTEIDLVILDVMLPLKDGFSICKEVRSHSVDTPVLMLTAKGEMEDRVKGLTIGADDYLVKPFAFEELLARVRSLLRRPKQSIQLTLQISPDISVNLAAHVVIKDGMEIPLTPKEFSLLEFLIRHKNQAVTQQAIFDHVFDFAKENWSNTVEVHIKNLRKKLFPIANESPLKTVRGVGYRLELQ